MVNLLCGEADGMGDFDLALARGNGQNKKVPEYLNDNINRRIP